jgi:carbon monoxide dehydrogenase subunit G
LKLENSFTVQLEADLAWRMLLDVERIVHCVPGAEITDVLDDHAYRGKVSVSLGPIKLAFAGKANFIEIDETARRARLSASGTDSSGRGGANAKLVFYLIPGEGKTEVRIETDLQLSGAVAQYGRASGIIEDVAAQIVDDFASCIRLRLDAGRMPPGDDLAAAARPDAVHQERAEPHAPIGGFAFAIRLILRRLTRIWTRLTGAA